MIEFYPEIRLVHIWSVFASGGLFALRGAGLLLAGQTWPVASPVRFLSYTIDTTLLTAAFMLMTIVAQYPFVDAWLTVKVLLLVVYITLGFMAFWPGRSGRERSRRARIGLWLAALLTFGFIYSVARAHHPLGIFSSVFG